MSNYHSSWKPLFDNYSIDIKKDGVIYPDEKDIYRVFEMDIKEIKILLLGQDPYHQPNQAHGLSFSVPKSSKIPPSLKNIFKEIKNEFPERNYEFTHGNLEKWFYREKIFLLNSALTVEKGKPTSHLKHWEKFTDKVIEIISKNNDECVFVLLGNYAKSKEKYITNKDKIITGFHPSPLSAYHGFFNSNIFTKIEQKVGKVNWQC
jgi:uracil-DNA glycosylase